MKQEKISRKFFVPQKNKVFLRRAQIQAGELVMVVIIVMVFLILGLAAYSGLKSEGYKEIKQELRSLDAIDLAQEALAMQELGCDFADEISTDCVDIYRLEAFAKKIEMASVNDPLYNYYRSKFGLANITIEQVYPLEKKWNVYETRRGNISDIPLRIPVYLYDPTTQTNSFAILTVVKFS